MLRVELNEAGAADLARVMQATELRRTAAIHRVLADAVERVSVNHALEPTLKQRQELAGDQAAFRPERGQTTRVRSTDENLTKVSRLVKDRASCEHGAAQGLCKIAKCRKT